MRIEVQVYTLHEQGLSFNEIARELNLKPTEVSSFWVKAEKMKDRFKQKEKIVYRKRLSNTDVKSRHRKLVNHMRSL